MKILSLVILLILSSACSSAKKSAILLSEKGLHEEAVAKWQEALKNDPDDEEVAAGLENSKAQVVNGRLTQVRDLRLSKDYKRALQSLKQLVKLEEAWSYKLDQNSANFKGKEALHLWDYFKQEISHELEKGFPLAAAHSYHEYKDLFSFVKSQEMTQEWSKIKKSGQKACSGLRDSPEYPYLSSFNHQYCQYFGSARKKKKTGLEKILYSRVMTENKIQGLPLELNQVMSTKLQTGLSSSPWYFSSSVQQIPLILTGSYQIQTSESEVPLMHEYLAQESYTDYEDVKKTVKVPYHVKENGSYVMKYKDEEITERTPVTRIRKVTKIFEYKGKKKTQQFTVKITGSFTLHGKSHNFEFSTQEKEDVIMHDYDLPSIGLKALKKDLTSPIEKFKHYSDSTAQKFQERALSVWTESFCHLPSQRDPQDIGENVLRCRRARSPDYQTFVSGWFANQHGVTPEIAELRLGGF